MKVKVMVLAVRPPLVYCERCSGRMFRGYDEDWICINCGSIVYDRHPVSLDNLKSMWEQNRPRRGRPRKVRDEQA